MILLMQMAEDGGETKGGPTLIYTALPSICRDQLSWECPDGESLASIMERLQAPRVVA